MKDETPALTQPPGQPLHKAPAGDPPVNDGRAAGAAPAPVASGSTPQRGTVAPAALLLALLALAAGGWSVWQMRDTAAATGTLRQELAARLAEGETLATEARGALRQQQEVIAALQGKLGLLEAKVEATEGQAQALEAMYQEFSRSREDGVVAEVEQAVALAAQQLQIAGNVEAALIALTEAEARLALHDRGQLAPLRRALASDIEALRLQPVLDVSGLSLRLERLLERADALPLAFEAQLPVAAAVGAELQPADAGSVPGWVAEGWRFAQALLAELWHEVRTLVRVERLDQDDPVLLAPAQNTFLRENLKIRLLTARLALLARDGRTYDADLAQARAWMERFYDRGDDRVQLALEEIAQLQGARVRYEPLDLTTTFGALRTVQARSARPATVAPPTLPPAAMPLAPAPAAPASAPAQ